MCNLQGYSCTPISHQYQKQEDIWLWKLCGTVEGRLKNDKIMYIDGHHYTLADWARHTRRYFQIKTTIAKDICYILFYYMAVIT